ncbi:MAG: glycerophosphodiester phosphodiesterase [Sandaracinus sp.]|nr:glycerophosphodiester phosphodiesterase [Myxococcales bacterium]MAT24722.1 glycerophosphodiester phosphodiesterase [Sandaracinus sp.]MBJ72176.1 glycerophosphodiester phosphodiesterase [Sandaracinus sp.]
MAAPTKSTSSNASSASTPRSRARPAASSASSRAWSSLVIRSAARSSSYARRRRGVPVKRARRPWRPRVAASISEPVKPYFGDGRRLLFAHRGGAKRWPENTLLAFEQAHALGYRWIETDIHLSADGELVVFHDETLERTTDGAGRVSDRTLAELKALDAAHRFSRDGGRTHPYRGQGVRIPTLEEALALDPELHLNLEMKGTNPAIADALWGFIEAHGVHDRVLAASAKDAFTERFRGLAGDRVATSPGVHGILRFWLGVRHGVWRWMRFPFDALQVPIRHGRLQVVDERFVRAAHRHGIQVHVWTIDDPREMRWLLAQGVDGIMTDRPEVLLHTVAS